MDSARALAAAFFLLLCNVAQARTSGPFEDAAKPSGFEYLDILGAEAVGEIGNRLYDTHSKDDYLGTSSVGGGYSMLGGFGLRGVIRFETGVRLSFEGSGEWGRMYNTSSSFTSFSTVTRGEFLTGIGYEIPCGKWFVLHTATMIGVDYQTMNVIPSVATTNALSMTASAAASSQPSLMLDQVALRLGQQVGFHVQLAEFVALYADGTVDYDGQWRVRAGISIGRVLPRKKY
jgi:hypothetical protein